MFSTDSKPPRLPSDHTPPLSVYSWDAGGLAAVSLSATVAVVIAGAEPRPDILGA
jgi:hypothetical protein